jgi:OmpA-OmpF porin, OOP family
MTTQQRVRAVLIAAGLGLAASGGAAAQDRSVEGFYFSAMGGASAFDFGDRAELDLLLLPAVNALLAAQTPPLTASNQTSSFDDSDMGWSVQVGYRFSNWVAAEVGYVNLGEALYEANMLASDGVNPAFPVETSLRFTTTGPTASILGMFAINERFDIHGRAGILFADTRLRYRIRDVELDANAVHIEQDGSTQDLFAGIGAAWNINDNYGVRVEYQRFFDAGDEDTSGEFDIDFIQVGILFR